MPAAGVLKSTRGERRGRGWTKISLACALALWTGTHSAVFSSCSPVVVEQYYDWYVVVVVVRPCRLHVLWSTSTPDMNLDVVVNSESPLDLFDRSSLSPLSTSARPNQYNRSICRCNGAWYPAGIYRHRVNLLQESDKFLVRYIISSCCCLRPKISTTIAS